jgi:hypothetical protein
VKHGRGVGTAGLLVVGAMFFGDPRRGRGCVRRDAHSITPACAFGDGAGYCALAEGRRAEAPFSRRPVAPLVTRAIPGALSMRFRAVALVSLLPASALAAALARRLARHAGLRDRRAEILVILTMTPLPPAGAVAA